MKSSLAKFNVRPNMYIRETNRVIGIILTRRFLGDNLESLNPQDIVVTPDNTVNTGIHRPQIR